MSTYEYMHSHHRMTRHTLRQLGIDSDTPWDQLTPEEKGMIAAFLGIEVHEL